MSMFVLRIVFILCQAIGLLPPSSAYTLSSAAPPTASLAPPDPYSIIVSLLSPSPPPPPDPNSLSAFAVATAPPNHRRTLTPSSSRPLSSPPPPSNPTNPSRPPPSAFSRSAWPLTPTNSVPSTPALVELNIKAGRPVEAIGIVGRLIALDAARRSSPYRSPTFRVKRRDTGTGKRAFGRGGRARRHLKEG